MVTRKNRCIHPHFKGMILVINGLKNGVVWKNLVFFPDDYEAAFDLLSNFVATGLTLLEASVGDDGQLLKLPVGSFDGQSISPHIQNLQKEWETILAERPKRAENQPINPFKEWDRQLIIYYEEQIERVCRNMVCNRKSMQKASQKQSLQRPAQLSHYQLMKTKYLQLLAGFQASHQKAIHHLEHLTGA